jgi:hypothetical protein
MVLFFLVLGKRGKIKGYSNSNSARTYCTALYCISSAFIGKKEIFSSEVGVE